jgi:hypothetical protein
MIDSQQRGRTSAGAIDSLLPALTHPDRNPSPLRTPQKRPSTRPTQNLPHPTSGRSRPTHHSTDDARQR